MATKTLTGATSYTNMRLNTTGPTVAKRTWTGGALTLSASDVVMMLPLVHGVTIVDGYIKGATAAALSGAVACRVETDDGTLVTASLSVTNALVRFTGVPLAVSLSDTELYDSVDITIISASTATVSCSFDLVLFYVPSGNVS